MGISDELRGLAATPPEATAMSASLADQAVGFAIKARRVARMKIAAAVTAGAIATTGVAIGVVTSNDNSDLPVSTPVVTITPSSSAPSQSPSASSPPQSASPEQSSSAPETSQAPILVQPSQPVQEPAGPTTDPNILEEILETLRSLPERIIEALKPDPPSEPDPGNGASPDELASPTISTPPSSPGSTPSPSESSPAQTPTATPSVPTWCYIEKYTDGNTKPIEATCEEGEKLRKELEKESPHPDSTAPTCELVTVPNGKEMKDGERTPVKCPDRES